MSRSRLSNKLASPQLAIWLIGILMAMSVVSFIVPQKALMAEEYEQFASNNPALARVVELVGFDDIFGSWLMIGVTTLLAINTTLCTVRRMRRKDTVVRPSVPASAESVALSQEWSTAEFLASAQERMKGARWKIIGVDDRGLIARKGRLGYYGSMLFHWSLLIIIIGGVLTALFQFKGRLAMTDGQEIIDEASSYSRIEVTPKIGPKFTGNRIYLDSTSFRYEQGKVVSAAAKMRGIDSTGKLITQDVRVNYPMTVGTRSYMLLDSGFAVAMGVKNPDGQQLSRVVRLSDNTDEGWKDKLDVAEVDGKRVQLKLIATPIPLGPGEKMPVEKNELKDPRLKAVLSIDGKDVDAVVLKEGESAELEGGYGVRFDDLVFWNGFRVTGQPARWVVYVGLWFSIIGIAWRLAVPERRISVVVDQGRVRAAMRARPWAGVTEPVDQRLFESIFTLAEGGPE